MKSPFGPSKNQRSDGSFATGGEESQPDVTGSPSPSQASRLARLSEYYWSAAAITVFYVMFATIIAFRAEGLFWSMTLWSLFAGPVIFMMIFLSAYRDEYAKLCSENSGKDAANLYLIAANEIIRQERNALQTNLESARGKAPDESRSEKHQEASGADRDNIHFLKRDLSIVRT